jgi:hypothetical protein
MFGARYSKSRQPLLTREGHGEREDGLGSEPMHRVSFNSPEVIILSALLPGTPPYPSHRGACDASLTCWGPAGAAGYGIRPRRRFEPFWVSHTAGSQAEVSICQVRQFDICRGGTCGGLISLVDIMMGLKTWNWTWTRGPGGDNKLTGHNIGYKASRWAQENCNTGTNPVDRHSRVPPSSAPDSAYKHRQPDSAFVMYNSLLLAN